MFSQYHVSSPGKHCSPQSHLSSSFSNGSLLHDSPIALRHTSQQPHLSLTTPVLQENIWGHTSRGSGQFPALSHQQGLQSEGTGIGFCAVMHDRNAARNDVKENNFSMVARIWDKIIFSVILLPKFPSDSSCFDCSCNNKKICQTTKKTTTYTDNNKCTR